MRKGYLANLEAGLLAEDNTEVTSVVDGESVLEEISNGCEDIIPDGYTEIDGEMTVTENLTDAIEEEEAIMEEVELPMVEAGAESDFNANTVKLLAASHRRLNSMMGVDEKRGAPVSALESDVYGGYKKAFVAGLEAKEGFLKTLKAKAAAAWKALLETLSKWIQKAVIFFNGAGKSAAKIEAVLKKKENKAAEGKDLKTTDSDKQDIAKKVGAWLMLGEKVENYTKYAEALKAPVVPAADSKLNLRTVSGVSIPSDISKALKIEKTDAYSLISVSGTTIKALALKIAADANSASPLSQVFPDVNGKYSNMEITATSVSTEEAAKKVGDTVMTIAQLESFTSVTAALAKELKTSANANYTAAESYSKAIKTLKEDEAKKGAALDKVSKVAMRIALENVAAYMTAMKTMLWFASTFAKRYEDKK